MFLSDNNDWIYVLIQGFADAGFTLVGDVLSDSRLMQRGIFSAEKYYTTGDQEYQKTFVFANEFYDNQDYAGNPFAKWSKNFKISAPGKYRLIGKCFNGGDGNCSLQIKKNGTLLNIFGSSTTNQYFNFDKVIEINIDEAETNPLFTFEYFGRVVPDKFNSDGTNIGIAEIQINPMRQNTVAGDPIPFVFNFNKVDLKKAVPDMTFGELVNITKNWGNYDLTFENSIATMNRILIDKTKEPEDFREFEIEDPYRNKNDKQYFNLKFPDVEGVDIDDVFFDESGYTLNKSSIPKTATEISINGFCLPIETFRATTTAKVFQENSTLMLVYYDGLDNNGDNHAKNPDGLHGIPFAESVKDWFLNRLTNFTFKWSFVALKSKIRNYNIRSEIFAYGKKHWIKSWVKNSISDRHYQIEIETETF